MGSNALKRARATMDGTEKDGLLLGTIEVKSFKVEEGQEKCLNAGGISKKVGVLNVGAKCKLNP